MRERLEYAAAWSVLKFLGLLPRPLARWTAARLAALIFLLRPPLRRAALFNLRLAFPGWPESRRNGVVREMVRNLGWMAAEFAHFPRYACPKDSEADKNRNGKKTIESAIVLDCAENFLAAQSRGKGVLFLTGHLGAWELSPFAHALYLEPIDFLVRPVDNPRVDALVSRYRALSGNRPIVKSESARAMLRTLKDAGTVGVLADLNTLGQDGIFVEFFGIPAATTSSVARLARHTGAAVVPAYSFWDAALRKYRLHYEPELALVRTDDAEADIRVNTAQFNRVIENYIRRYPDQWLWVHRRWRLRPPGEPPIYPDEGPDERPGERS
jgi:Kdo2-lipid IVA lauroyltransferase/acyltransferase